MLEILITSKTRVKLLLKFFLNAEVKSYLRSLANEFRESTNAIRVELNRLESAGLLVSFFEGNKKFFRANRQHPLFAEISSLVHSNLGINEIISSIITKLGSLDRVFIVGELARGIVNDKIEILIIGDNIDKVYLTKLMQNAEKKIKREIDWVCLSTIAFQTMNLDKHQDMFLIWERE